MIRTVGHAETPPESGNRANRFFSILNTASIVGVMGQDNHAAYVSTKGGMISPTKAMAVDYAPFGMRLNAIYPAAVWTPMEREWRTHLPILRESRHS